jgi:LuxR family maltose regulon positive regulatory protein
LRPRIFDVLQAADEAAVTLVAAPPGYGKTTAVQTWCASRRAPVAWVTLDKGDNDPVRLWAYVATAADRIREGLGRSALQRLAVAGGSIEFAVDDLLNGLAGLEEKIVIVLDDLHTVTDGECLASIDRALARLPQSVRLILITRTDPALKLAPFRAAGALVELRSEDLAFTAAEAHALLVDRGGVDLGADEIDTLRRRTEGWPAALVLASIWLRAVDDPRRAVAEFGGEQRFVAEYLSQVVLATLDEETRWFLLRASVLGHFTPELCDSVLGWSNSAATLAGLERSNLLVSRLRLAHEPRRRVGGRDDWYRVHPLFAEFARSQLATLDPDAEIAIHRRASSWSRARGHVLEAIDQAFAAEDYDTAAELVAEHQIGLFRSGGMRTLLNYVRALPDHLVYAHLEVAAGAAVVTTMIGCGALERRRYLSLVSRAEAETPERVSGYVSGLAAMIRAISLDGGVKRAVGEGRRAVSIAQSGVDELSVSSRAGCAYALYFSGDVGEAWTLATELLEHPDVERRAPGHAFARATLALVALDLERREAARLHAEKAKSILGGIGSSRSWLGAHAAAALGSVHASDGDYGQAEHDLAHAEKFFRDEVASVQHTWLLLMLARVRCRRGRLEDAEAALRAARVALCELGDTGRLPAMAAEVELELAAAAARASEGELLTPPSDAERAVLRLLGTDLTTRQIAERLFLSHNTIRSHTRALYRKLGVGSRAEAVARAAALGLLDGTQSPG